MKQKRFYAMSGLLAMLLFAGCGNDENGIDGNSPVEIRLTSGLEVRQVGTRADTGIQDSQFDKDEKVDVYINEDSQYPIPYKQPLVYTADGEGGLAIDKQQYFPTSGYGVNIYAIYPTSTKQGETFTVQTDQSSDADYRKSDLMYGKPESNPVARTDKAVNLNFTHLLSKVTITLTNGAGDPGLDGAVVKLKQVQPSTTFTANATEGTISEASGEKTDITVMTSTSMSGSSGSAIVVPQTLATSFIEVTLDGRVLTSGNLTDSEGTSLNEIVLAGGTAYKYDITVNRTDLDITSSITHWKGGNTVRGSVDM